MKKFLFLFVVMAFVVVMATGAFANEVGTDCVTNPCPDCTEEDTLEVTYSLLAVSCLDIQDEAVCVQTDIPCTGTCWGDPECWTYTVTATGCSERKIIGKVQDVATAGAKFQVKFNNTGGWKTLGNSDLDVATGYSNVCNDYTAQIRVGAEAGACEACNETATLWFKIVDLGEPCNPCGA